MPLWPLILFPFWFLFVWWSSARLMAWMGGWSLLAKSYKAPAPLVGDKLRMRSARFARGSLRELMPVRYNNCLTFTTTPAGLGIAMTIFFRSGHPTLLIPWSDIRIAPLRGIFFRRVQLTFAREPRVSFSIRPALEQRLRDQAGPA